MYKNIVIDEVDIMAHKCITPKELAFSTCLSAATISGYRSGLRSPTLFNLYKIAKVLDVSILDLCPSMGK